MALVLLMSPVYWILMQNRNKYLCKTNLGQVFKAMELYLIDNDNRYPPLFVQGEKGEPQLFEGKPYTWMSLIQECMGERYSFKCPSASDEENVKNLPFNPDRPAFASSYGMYAAWSSWNSTFVVNPNTSILLAETANAGANDTFDPLPFSHGIDGISIGWNDDNFKPTGKSDTVTRLAFPASKSGTFLKDGRGRHGPGIHVLYSSGQLGFVHPDAARIQRIGTEIVGRWANR